MLEHIEYKTDNDPDSHPQHSIIWLHGLGADGNDFVPIASELALPIPVRFIFPHAPEIPVTLNGGYVMRAWYDIYSLSRGGPQDEAGVRRSQIEIEALIAQQIALGIPAAHIMLAGFSQGGAIVLQTALRYPQRLAGVMALSTYLPISATLEQEKTQANMDIPFFMAHGSFDEVITLDTGNASRLALQKAGYNVQWHEYAMSHSVCSDEIADIRRFIIDAFGITA
ncbi:MAG TPA: alpha/beta fold hydrolase [Methylophilaceae bacterium]|jgi:phospholipase/carboxylesterase